MAEASKSRSPWRRLGISAARIAAMLIAVFAGLWWLMIRMPGSSHRGPLAPLDAREQDYERELRDEVATIAAIGERHGGAPQALARAVEHLAAGLSSTRPATRLPYDDDGRRFENIELELPGTRLAGEIVVIGAHYDTVEHTAGADDNTSGAAALVVLARRFASRPLARTLRFVAFANEEPPYFQNEGMGSLVYARRCKSAGDRVVAMLSLETIGYYSDAPGSQSYPFPFSAIYPSQGNFVALVGNVASRDLVRRAVGSFRRNAAFPSEGVAAPAAIPGVGWSDQWSFWQSGYPALMVTDTALFRYRPYHTPDDTPDKLDYPRLARVVAGLEAVITDLAER